MRVSPSHRRLYWISAGIIAAGILGCSSGGPFPPYSDHVLALGTWGGDSAGMIVSDTAMHLHISCTYGDVSGRVPVGGDGRIDAAGSYMLRAYPVAVGPTVPAHFTGRVVGGTVLMTVTVDDTVKHTTVVRGPVKMTYGAAPKLGPCPICRRPIVTRGGISGILAGVRQRM